MPVEAQRHAAEVVQPGEQPLDLTGGGGGGRP
jgi:hypothetical protein